MTPRQIIRSAILCWLPLVCLPVSRADLPQEPILRLEPGRHAEMITQIDVDRSGRWLVSASEDKTVRVWDAGTGRLGRVLRPPIDEKRGGLLHAVAISPDGSLVACGGWTSPYGDQAPSGFFVYLFSRADGRLLKQIGPVMMVISHLAFSPDGQTLAATGSHGLAVFALGGGVGNIGRALRTRLIAEDYRYGDLSAGVHFSPESRWLVTSAFDGYIRLYDLSALRLDSVQPSQTITPRMRQKQKTPASNSLPSSDTAPKTITPSVKQKAPGGGRPCAVKFSPDGSKVAVGFSDTTAVDVLSASDLRLLKTLDTAPAATGDLRSVTWSSDGRYLFAGGEYTRQEPEKGSTGAAPYHPLLRWSAEAPAPAELASGATNTIVDLASLPDGSLVIGAADPTLALLGPDGRQKWMVVPSIADFRGTELRLSEDGLKAGFQYRRSAVDHAIFSLADRSLVFSPADGSLFPPRTSAPGLDLREWKDSAAPTLNGQRLRLVEDEVSHSTAISWDGQSMLLGTNYALRRFSRDGAQTWAISVPDGAWAVNIAGKGTVAAAACGDGTIRWYRYSDGQELAVAFPHADRKRWVVWTPSGYYDASPGGEELIGWHVNNPPDNASDFYPASSFRAVKYRPDVISKILGVLDEAEAVRLADTEVGRAAMLTTVAQALPPVINITDPQDGSPVSTSTVTLRYIVRTPSGEPVTGIRALVDGRPVASSRGVKLAAKEGEGQTVDVTIPARDCEVALIAENRFGASTPATVRLMWGSPSQEQADEFVAKPKLYLLAVGISAYQKPELKLGYAAKDAKDFAAAMQAQKGSLYRDVEVKLLPDAPKEDIEDGLEWLRRQVTSRDVGIIFLAGHGVDDPNGVYYFLPANADLDRLMRTGLVFSDLKNTVQSIAGKAVMFVDTCHSGNVMGARRGVADINAVINELASAENGVVVFAASTGRQYSLEDPQWQNGAFTKALVEGIGGKAEYGGKGKITVNMLDLYLSERVKELTKGQQTPATSKPSTVPDFPLAVKR